MDGKITRRRNCTFKRYDLEFPERHIKSMFDYCDVSLDELNSIVNSWRSDHIWEKKNNEEFCLKYPIWNSN